MTITEFLLARIAEDEAVAREAMLVVTDDLTDCRIGEWWEKVEHGRVYAGHWHRVVDGGGAAGHRSFANTAALPHIAHHDPARVLAECEAKRRIVEWHKPLAGPGGFAPNCEGCWVDGGEDGAPLYPCRNVKWLASIYADHPDFDPAWRDA